jgi:hypothetical protein
MCVMGLTFRDSRDTEAVLPSNQVMALTETKLKNGRASLLQTEVKALRGSCAIDTDMWYVNRTMVIIASRKPTCAVRNSEIIVIK